MVSSELKKFKAGLERIIRETTTEATSGHPSSKNRPCRNQLFAHYIAHGGAPFGVRVFGRDPSSKHAGSTGQNRRTNR